MLSDLFWKRLTVAVVQKINVPTPHRAPAADDAVRPVPIERRWPGLAGTPLVMSSTTPRSERPSRAQAEILRFVFEMKERMGLAESYPEPYLGEGAPYPQEYLALHPKPELPDDFAPGADRLAGVASRGPFSLVTRQAEGGGFELDLRHIEALELRPGLLRAGGRAVFRREGGQLRTECVELEGARHRPGEAGWPLIEKRLLVGLNSHMTFIEHLISCHMCVAGSYTLATYEALPSWHPLRALLQPFIIETMRVNNDNIDGLIKTEHSNVPSYTGYPLATLNEVIRTVARGFDLRLMDPEWRARDHGTLDQGFVTVQSRVEMFRMFREMTARYAREVLRELDPETRVWVQLVDRYIPGGVQALIGLTSWEELTLDQVAHVVAVCAFTSSVTHHVVADMVRDYMMQFHLMPPALADAGLPRRGMVLEKMNSITIAGILRYRLVDSTVVLPAGAAREVWGDFQAKLRAYQAQVDATEATQRRHLIHPDHVPSSIHA